MRRWRLTALGVAGSVLLGELVWAVSGLPGFGGYAHRYGPAAGRAAAFARHATNAPTAVNFDVRAIDTLGEEFILFAAALALALIVRSRRDPGERPPETTSEAFRQAGPGEATRVASALLIAPAIVLGLYIVAHGHLTPGGGFQGGVILAGGILLAELAGTGSIVRRVAPLAMLEALESSGAAGYAAIGAIGLAGGAYFHNWLPRGTVGELASAGTIPVANVVVTLEVTSAFLLVWSELRDRSLILKDDRGESER